MHPGMSEFNIRGSMTDDTTGFQLPSEMGGMDNEDHVAEVTTKVRKLGFGDGEEHAEKPFKEETESITPDSKDEPIWNRSIWLACKTGGYKKVEEYLQNAEQSSLLTHGRDRNDNTALVVAAVAPHKNGASTKIMELLLKAGADINATNCVGRTALMEASLWGRLKAVETLLRWHIPACLNIELRDSKGLKAIDLAFENEDRSKERYFANSQDGPVERPFIDVPFRKKIVQLLLEKYERNASQLQARLDEVEDKMKKLEAELDASRVANRKIQGELTTKQYELNKANAQCLEQLKTMDAISNQVGRATDQIGRLNRGRVNNNSDVQFQERKLQDGTFETQVDFIQTFRIASASYYLNGQPTHRRTTIAHMKIDGHSYFAKNGLHNDTEHGFISGAMYTEKARTLFRALGSTLVDTWFQHSEAQFMALYVERYRDAKGLTIVEFKDFNSDVSGNQENTRNKVRIFASRKVCRKCGDLEELLNATAVKHGFEFILEYVLVKKEET